MLSCRPKTGFLEGKLGRTESTSEQNELSNNAASNSNCTNSKKATGKFAKVDDEVTESTDAEASDAPLPLSASASKKYTGTDYAKWSK